MTLTEMMQALLDGKTLISDHYSTNELSLVDGEMKHMCINPLFGDHERAPNYEVFGRPEVYRVKE